MRRRDVAVAPARHVTARGLAGDCLLAGDQAGDDLDLGIADRLLLRLGKPPDIVPGKADVVLELLGDQSGGRVNFVAGEDDVAVIAVEFGRIAHCRFVPRRLDLVENGLHRRPDISGIVGGLAGGLLEIVDGH